MFRHVIWDMGGTLVDTYPQLNAAFAGVVEAHGASVAPEEVAALTHVSTAHAIDKLVARFDIDEDEFTRANTQLKRYWESRPAPVKPGARELMTDITARGGLNLVATHRDRRSATSLLATLGLRVDDLVCPQDGFARKPDPGMHLELMARHGLDPGDCLAVGDRALDVGAAHAAGMAAARIGPVRDGQLPQPEYTISDLFELRPLFGLDV